MIAWITEALLSRPCPRLRGGDAGPARRPARGGRGGPAGERGEIPRPVREHDRGGSFLEAGPRSERPDQDLEAGGRQSADAEDLGKDAWGDPGKNYGRDFRPGRNRALPACRSEDHDRRRSVRLRGLLSHTSTSTFASQAFPWATTSSPQAPISPASRRRNWPCARASADCGRSATRSPAAPSTSTCNGRTDGWTTPI